MQLSDRQKEALILLSNDLKVCEVAQYMGIAEHSVYQLVVNACKSLDVTTRHGAIARALREGIIQ